MLRASRRRKDFKHDDIPTKANRILYFILVAMLLILIRIWHLAVIQYDQKVEESQKPQRKSIIQPAIRATIRDRFNQPLAINKISYQATLLYSQLREIPSIAWEKDATGMRLKIYKRKEYIRQLAQLLAKELALDHERVEDLIHAKASYYSQVPFVIKENLTEGEYYRLKMLEKDWPGLHVRHLPLRHYPKGRVAADVIGYLGAINRQEYEKILHEMKALDQLIKEHETLGEDVEETQEILQARTRLTELEDKAYSIHDYVGKTGIEGSYEEILRGFYGKRNFYTDSKGNFLGDLPGSKAPLPGHRILLSLSSELQEYAEQLLAQNEELRVVRKSNLGANKKTILAQKQPWMKGGAIVVLDPHDGEVLALASYPRFDPNDFILSGDTERQKEKKSQIHRWFENELYLAQLWNQQQPLERERYDDRRQTFHDEKRFLTWKNYLHFILPSESHLRQAVDRIDTLAQAIHLQRQIENLRSLCPGCDLYSIFNTLYVEEEHLSFYQTGKGKGKLPLLESDSVAKIKQKLARYFSDLPQNYDKVLLVDLCRLAVAEERFSSELLDLKGSERVENYHNHRGSLVTILSVVKEKAKALYHDLDFKPWREREEKGFLKRKREEEKLAKAYPKPYIDYLDQQESHLFQLFWEAHAWDLLIAFLSGKESQKGSQSLNLYLDYFCNWHQHIQKENEYKWKNDFDVLHTIMGSLPSHLALEYLKSMRPFDELNRPLLGSYRYIRQGGKALEKHLAAAFYPVYGFGYGRSHAYRQAAIQGSLFKLVTAYEALLQRYQKIGQRVVSPQELNPLVIIDEVYSHGSTRFVGYTEDGKPIPQLYKGGRLPRSLAHQHNGKVDLLRALEVSSNPYFSLLAGECLNSPTDLSDAARKFAYGKRTGIDLPAEISGRVPDDLATNRTGLYAMAIGQHSLVVTPLQTAVMLATIANGGKVLKPKLIKLTAGRSLSNDSLVTVIPTRVTQEVFMPDIIRHTLLKGLRAASLRTHQESLSNLARLYKQYPEAIKQFAELKDQLLGKTSTSESVENIDLDLQEGTNIYTHCWFGSIAFHPNDKKKTVLLLKDEFGQPELIVVIYLRYGGYGKEAAPLAAQMVKKWRELRVKYEKS